MRTRNAQEKNVKAGAILPGHLTNNDLRFSPRCRQIIQKSQNSHPVGADRVGPVGAEQAQHQHQQPHHGIVDENCRAQNGAAKNTHAPKNQKTVGRVGDEHTKPRATAALAHCSLERHTERLAGAGSQRAAPVGPPAAAAESARAQPLCARRRFVLAAAAASPLPSATHTVRRKARRPRPRRPQAPAFKSPKLRAVHKLQAHAARTANTSFTHCSVFLIAFEI